MNSALRPPTLRAELLGDADRDVLTRLVHADPVVNSVVSARLQATGTIEPRPFGGSLLGVRDAAGRLAAAAFHGGNLLPLGGAAAELRALADHVLGGPRLATSIVGRASAVETMWEVLEPVWGPARAVRRRQPLLVLDRADSPAHGDPRVRAITHREVDAYLPAAAAMFTEELGVSPYRATTAGDYRRRVTGLIAAGRAFGVVDDDGSVLFKADIGAVSARTCQVQGVWVRPDLRGRGLGGSALAVVLRHALTLAPTVSLYVNDFNTAARRMYARLGMRQVATLSTVLL
jgi:predicted GNAT family acetyltransferase